MSYDGGKVTFWSAGGPRSGDIYAKPTADGWEINAGVDSWGHDPGYGTWCTIGRGSKEMADFEAFLSRADSVRSFLQNEFGFSPEEATRLLRRIWLYISA